MANIALVISDLHCPANGSPFAVPQIEKLSSGWQDMIKTHHMNWAQINVATYIDGLYTDGIPKFDMIDSLDDVGLVVFLGDIFHDYGKMSVRQLTAVHSMMSDVVDRFPDAEIYVVGGNHDMDRYGSSGLALLQSAYPRLNVVLGNDWEKKYLSLDDKTVVGFVAYAASEEVRAGVIDGSDIIFCHRDIRGAVYLNGNPVSNGDEVSPIYAVSGHIHNAQVINSSDGVKRAGKLDPMCPFFPGSARQTMRHEARITPIVMAVDLNTMEYETVENTWSGRWVVHENVTDDTDISDWQAKDIHVVRLKEHQSIPEHILAAQVVVRTEVIPADIFADRELDVDEDDPSVDVIDQAVLTYAASSAESNEEAAKLYTTMTEMINA